MTRFPLLAASLLVIATVPAGAQAKPDISKQLLGVWEGPYSSEAVPPGTLKLSVAQGDKKEWKVTLEVASEQPPPAGDVREFAVDGNSVSWMQTIAEMECKSTATLVAGILKGTAECTQGGAVAVTATFMLEKKKM